MWKIEDIYRSTIYLPVFIKHFLVIIARLQSHFKWIIWFLPVLNMPFRCRMVQLNSKSKLHIKINKHISSIQHTTEVLSSNLFLLLLESISSFSIVSVWCFNSAQSRSPLEYSVKWSNRKLTEIGAVPKIYCRKKVVYKSSCRVRCACITSNNKVLKYGYLVACHNVQFRRFDLQTSKKWDVSRRRAEFTLEIWFASHSFSLQLTSIRIETAAVWVRLFFNQRHPSYQ